MNPLPDLDAEGARVRAAVSGASAPDWSLYECEACSAKSGSPTLCADCLRRRDDAGSRWLGQRPLRVVVNGAGAHAPADAPRVCTHPADLDGTDGACPAYWRGDAHAAEVWRQGLAERDATIGNLRTRLESSQVVVLQLRDDVHDAVRERDEWAERCRDLRARLAAAQRASASIPAPAGGPWSEADREAYLRGYVSAADARAAGHHLPAAAGPAADGPPSPPDSTAPAGSGAAPTHERGPAVPSPSRPGAWILPRVTR